MPPLMRSFCKRSMMMTSAPRMPSAMSLQTRTPMSFRSPGTRVLGPTARMSGTPRVVRAWMSERATRLCTMSPTMATRSCVNSFLWCRMVYMSSRPCVGWAWRPSPALTTCTSSRPMRRRCSVIRKGAPLEAWRTTNRLACMATRLSMVSSRVSPLAVDDLLMSRLMTSALKRLAAISKVVRVRVEFSKNRLKTLLPRSSGTFLTSRAETSMKDSAVSRIWVRMRCGRPSIDSRWLSSPSLFNCGLCIFFQPPGELTVVVAGQDQVLAVGQGDIPDLVGSAYRQLAAAAIGQHGQRDRGRTTVVEQLIDRRAGSPPGVEHVIDQDDMAPLDIERNDRRPALRMQALLGKVVAVEGDVDQADLFGEAEQLPEALGDPGAAAEDADQRGMVGELRTDQVGQLATLGLGVRQGVGQG